MGGNTINSTPRKWQVKKWSEHGLEKPINCSDYFITTDDADVCYLAIYTDKKGNKAKTNAHLIAAAKELYKTLEATLKIIKADNWQASVYAQTISDAKQSLAKARGDDDDTDISQ